MVSYSRQIIIYLFASKLQFLPLDSELSGFLANKHDSGYNL